MMMIKKISSISTFRFRLSALRFKPDFPGKIAVLVVASGVLAACSVKRVTTEVDLFKNFDTEAHRGGRGLMPENTIPAMLYSVDLGVNTLEMDTHITSDGKVIVAHDDYMNPAFALAPGGKEIPTADNHRYPIFQMTYADLSNFDVGTRFYPAFPQQKKIAVAMPLLSSLIDSVQAHLRKTGKKQVFYNIETKCDEAGDNLLNPIPEEFVKLLMQVIEQKKITPYVVIQSFDKRTLQVLHRKYPAVKTAYLIENNKKSLNEHLTELGFTPTIYSPAFKLVNAELVSSCRAKGIKLVPWTVNTKADMLKLRLLGVDGMISDYPDVLLAK